MYMYKYVVIGTYMYQYKCTAIPTMCTQVYFHTICLRTYKHILRRTRITTTKNTLWRGCTQTQKRQNLIHIAIDMGRLAMSIDAELQAENMSSHLPRRCCHWEVTR